MENQPYTQGSSHDLSHTCGQLSACPWRAAAAIAAIAAQGRHGYLDVFGTCAGWLGVQRKTARLSWM